MNRPAGFTLKVSPSRAIEWLPGDCSLVDFLREPFPGEALVSGYPYRQMFFVFLLHLWPPGIVLSYNFIAAVRADDNPHGPRE